MARQTNQKIDWTKIAFTLNLHMLTKEDSEKKTTSRNTKYINRYL